MDVEHDVTTPPVLCTQGECGMLHLFEDSCVFQGNLLINDRCNCRGPDLSPIIADINSHTGNLGRHWKPHVTMMKRLCLDTECLEVNFDFAAT